MSEKLKRRASRGLAGAANKKSKKSKVEREADDEQCAAMTMSKLKFQHKAMVNRISQKNRELKDHESQLKFFRVRHKKHARALSTVHRQWKTLISDLHNILDETNLSTSAPDKVSVVADIPSTTTTKHPFLQLFTQDSDRVNGEAVDDPDKDDKDENKDDKDEDEDDKTDKKTTHTARSLDNEESELEKLVEQTQRDLLECAKRTAQLLKRVVVALDARRTETIRLSEHLTQQDDEKDKAISASMKECQALRDEVSTLKVQLKPLDEEEEKLKEEELRWSEEKQSLLLRLHDRKWEINKLQRQANLLTTEVTRAKSGLTRAESTGNIAKALDASVEAGETEQSKDGIDTWKALAESRLKDQDALREANLALETQINQMKDQSISEAVEIKDMDRRLQVAVQDAQAKQQTVDQLQHELAMVKEARDLDKTMFAESETTHLQLYREREAALQAKSDQLAQDLVLMEKARDHLEMKARDSTPDSDKALLAADFTATFKKLESKMVALQEENGALQKGSIVTERDKHVRHVLFRENIIKRRQAEVKIRELEAEGESLKTSAPLDKQATATLTASEAKLKKENEQLNKTIDDLRATIQGGEVADQLEEQKIMSEELMAALDDLARSYEDMQTQNQRLLFQNKKQEKTNVKLATERIKTAKQVSLSRQEKEIIINKLNLSNTKNDKQLELLKQQDVRAKICGEKQAKTDEMLSLTLTQLDTLREAHSQKTQTLDRTKDEFDKTKRVYKEMKKKYDEELKASDAQKRKIRELKESLSTTKRKCERLTGVKSQASAEGNEGLEAELKLCKQRLTCSVCSDRDKSVIITKCFHLFCAECIEQNLKVRHRKCPGCGLGFDRKDVQPIYLT